MLSSIKPTPPSSPPQVGGVDGKGEREPRLRNLRVWLKTAGLGAIIFFTIKGLISGALLLWGGSALLRGCG